MNLLFPVIELLDRYAIAAVKYQHTDGSNQLELEYYQKQIANLDLESIQGQMAELQQIHAKIWSLEKELKSGCENDLPLEQIGRRAITIRDWNRERIRVKNLMADIVAKDQVREFKKDHLSE